MDRIRTYDAGSGYLATRSEYTYLRDGNNKPIYGRVRSIVDSEWNGSSWVVHSKKFFAYTEGSWINTTIINDLRYVVNHPSTEALCSSAGNDNLPNTEYTVCGSNPVDYYDFTSYYYDTTGRLFQIC